MKSIPILKTILVVAIGALLAPLSHADDRKDRDRHNHHDDDRRHEYQRDDRRYNDYRSSRADYNRRYYLRNGGYYYGRPGYYYSRPSTSISLGFGTGYVSPRYATHYYREDERPIYRGEQVAENRPASLGVAVQSKLSKLGYYNGEIDGDIGPASRRAIIRYQRENDLAATGRIDRELIDSLDLG